MCINFLRKGKNTSDATAIAEDMLLNKTAYANNQKIIGTMPNNGELNFIPKTEIQLIPKGYVTGGKINAVDSSIDSNILPENIKKDISILGVTGTLESGGSSDSAKLFKTIGEMQSDTTAKKGEIALVYQNDITPAIGGQTLDSIFFPAIVVLDECITSEISDSCSGGYTYFNFILTPTEFTFQESYMETTIIVQYTSTDGITYQKNSEYSDTYNQYSITMPSSINENLTKFITQKEVNFTGVYNYDGTQWNIAENQLTLMNPNELLPNTQAFGKNGLITGDGSIAVPDYSFLDITANLYKTIQDNYEKMETIVITDKTIDKNIPFIYTKRDGKPLWDISQLSDTSSMFEDCSKLTEIPLLNTSNVTNMARMFDNCSNLTRISLLNTSKVTNMESTFGGCSKLTELPLIDTSNVTNMQNMLSGCDNLTTIPLLNTGNAVNMRRMFCYCDNLTTIPLLDTKNVTDMSYMFERCPNLTTISLLNTSNVKNMINMFKGCSKLTEIPQLNTSNVTNMRDMFSDCSLLTTIPLLNTSKVTDMGTMFYSCTKLIEIPLLDTSSVTYMYRMFTGCTSLSNESLNNILAMCTNATKMTFNKTLKDVGLTQEQATKCKTLSNYSAFTAAGWTTGY